MEKKIISVRDQDIIIPDKKEVFLLDHIKSGSSRPPLHITIGRNARVQYVCIFEPYGDGDFKQERVIDIEGGARVEGYQAYFGSGNSEFRISHNLGDKSIFNNRVLFYQTGEQNFKVQDDYTFQGQGATGKFQVEGLADGQAVVQYYSEVIIKPQAQQTDSRIDMRLHLLSKQAKGNLLPGLKIDANEVKAGHGASTFHLSPEDLFYLRSRGLNAKQIKSMVINSLANKFTADISDAAARETILLLIQERAAPAAQHV
jgi:Fe-S cluster assembly scaffold protein SufB